MTNKHQGSGLKVHTMIDCSLSDLPVKAFSLKVESLLKAPLISDLRRSLPEPLLARQTPSLCSSSVCRPQSHHSVLALSQRGGGDLSSHTGKGESPCVPDEPANTGKEQRGACACTLSQSPVSEMYGAVILSFSYAKPALQSSQLF